MTSTSPRSAGGTVRATESEGTNLAALYLAHRPAIYACCRRILRDPTAAEDASQETFIRVLRRGGQVPPSPEVRRWMYRIAINFCRNVLRDAHHRSRVDATLGMFTDLSRPENTIVDRDMIRRLINQAPIALRAAAWWHHVEGLNQSQVAGRLGVSRRTVVTRLAAFAQHTARFRDRTGADADLARAC